MIINIKSKLKLVAITLSSILPNTLLNSRYFQRTRILFIPSIKERAYNGNIEAQFLLKLDFLGKMVYDIGSSIGIFTQFFAESVGKKGFVVAFEPNPKIYKQLKDRIGRDIGSNILAVNACVGSSPGESLLIFRESQTGTGSIDPDIQTSIVSKGAFIRIKVPMCSLDSHIFSNGGHKPDFIKIDAEGAEYDILKGAVKVLNAYHPELFIEIHGATRKLKEENIERIVSFLKLQGYLIHHVESGQTISFENYLLAQEGHIYCVARGHALT